MGASLLGVVGGLPWVGGLRMGSSDRAGHELTYGTGSMAACIGLTLVISIPGTSQPWRLYLFVLLYGFGYGALGPAYAAAMVDRFSGQHLGMGRED